MRNVQEKTLINKEGMTLSAEEGTDSQGHDAPVGFEG